MALLNFTRPGLYATFSDLGDDPLLTDAGSSGVSFDATGGRYGERALQDNTDSTTSYFEMSYANAGGDTGVGGTVILNFSFKVESFNTGRSTMLAMTRSSIFSHNWAIEAFADGSIRIQDATLARVATVARGFIPHEWNHWEIRVTHDNAPNGTFELWSNGVKIVDETGLDTIASAAGPAEKVLFYGFDKSIIGTETGITYGDIVMMDDTGTVLNDVVGDMRFEVALPTGDGTTTAWTRNAGANDYEAIDEAEGAYDDDTSYLESSSVSDDTYHTFPSTLTDVNTVFFAGLVSRVKNDAGSAPLNVQHIVDSGGTVATGTATASLGASYTFVLDAFPEDPNASAAWTKTTLDAAEFGIRSVT